MEHPHPQVEDEEHVVDGEGQDHDGVAQDWTGDEDGQDDLAVSDSDEHFVPAHEQGEQQPAPKNAAPRTLPRPARRTRNRPNWMEQEDPYSQNQQMTAPQRQRRQQNEMFQTNQEATQPEEGKTSSGKDPLKLRLDLNLEVEIELKARIHGDLTLALL